MSYFSVLFIFSHCMWSIAGAENECIKADTNGTGCERWGSGRHSFFYSKKWITQIFMEAEASFHIDEYSSVICRRDFHSFRQHLATNQTKWAVQMFESSEWPRVGILAGRTHHLGNWGACVNANANDFKGRYCLVEADFNFNRNESTSGEGNELSAWRELQSTPGQKIHWAMCVPSSCQPAELELSLQRTLGPVFENYNQMISFHVDPKMCSVKNNEKFPSSFHFTVSFFLLWILLVFVVSIWNYNSGNKKATTEQGTLTSRFTHLFDLSQNFANLTNCSSDKVYPVLYMMNGVVSMLIICLHRVFFNISVPSFSSEHMEMIREQTFQFILGNILDVSFMISGYLLYDLYMHKFSTTKVSNLAVFLFFRWLRKISLPALILLVVTYTSLYVADGPLNYYFLSPMAGSCKSRWWNVIFAVNNFDTSEYMCLLHTWFTSAEIQLTTAGTILLFIMGRHKKIGRLFAFFLFISATFVAFKTIKDNKLSGLFEAPFSEMKLNLNISNIRLSYMRPFARLGPYLLGIFTANVVEELKVKFYKFSLKEKILILSISCAIAVRTIAFGWSLDKSDVMINALYGAVYRTLLTLPFACFLCIFFTSGFGTFDRILENKIIIIYGRLLNCIYLLGPVLQYFQVASQRTFVTPSMTMLIWLIAGDLFLTLIISIAVHLIIEAPMLNIFNNWRKHWQQI